MTAPLKILLLEDSVADAELVGLTLTRARVPYEIRRVDTKDEFQRELAEYEPDIILSDHTMPGYDGLSALAEARNTRPDIPFVFVSGTLGEANAVESLKHGASDYVVKGDLMRLPSAIERALKEKRLRLEREQLEQKLRNSESLFKSLAEQAPIGIVLNDTKMNVLFVNDAWDEIAGRVAKDIFTEDWPNLMHADDREHVAGTLAKFLQNQQPVNFEYRFLRASGEIRWLSARLAGLYNAAGEFTGFIGLTSDITEQKLAEQKVARLSRIQAVLSGINSTIVRATDVEQLCNDACRIAADKGNFPIAWIHVVDAETGKVTTTTAAGKQVTPELFQRLPQPGQLLDTGRVSARAYADRQALVINSMEDFPSNQANIAVMRKRGIASIVFLPLMLGESIFGVLVLTAETADFFTTDEMQLLKELAEDIAFALDHLAKKEQLNYLAYYDSLTGLPNRTLFFDHLRQHIYDAQREDRRFGVLAVDIERFRHINESFGEHFGDALLQAVAERLTKYAKSSGLMGRLSGDSFGIISPAGRDITALAQVFERNISEWAKTPFKLLGKDINVPVRAGVAIFPDDGKDAETLFRNASAALKQAKTSGERLLFYSEEINARVAEHLQLEIRMRTAIEQQQFILHYQPKVDLVSHEVKSVEALIRWIDPERGMVPPGEFVPILEQSGLIYEVGLWALQRACDDYAELCKRFSAAPTIAVNVSALQLKRKNFHEEVLGVIDKAPDGRHGVDIEITESLLMHDIEDNIRKLKKIRDHNVHIAVDDFGTGYSSLSYIARLPIDVLKIDRSFVIKMAESSDDLAIVSTIITLAHSLNLKVVAEGVETEEQARMLRLLKCDEAQGFLFCRPLALKELIVRLHEENGLLRLAAKPAD